MPKKHALLPPYALLPAIALFLILNCRRIQIFEKWLCKFCVLIGFLEYIDIFLTFWRNPEKKKCPYNYAEEFSKTGNLKIINKSTKQKFYFRRFINS